jgi:WD40 repeat protein
MCRAVTLTLFACLFVVGVGANLSAQAPTIMPIAILEATDEVFYRLEWQPNGTTLAVATAYDEVRLYNTDLQLIGQFQGHSELISDIAWNPDGTLLASASFDYTARIWDVASQQTLSTIENLSGEVTIVRWSDDGQRLAVVADDRSQEPYDGYGYYIVSLWNVSDPSAPVLEYTLPSIVGVRSVSWSVNNTSLTVANNMPNIETSIRFWDISTGQLEFERIYSPNAIFRINDFARRPTSNVVAIAESLYAGISLYNPSNDQFMMRLEGHTGSARAVDWDLNGERLVSGDENGVIIIWDMLTTQRLATFDEGIRINDVDWSPNDQFIASISGANTIRIWDVSALSAPHTLPTVTYYPIANWDGTPIPPTAPTVTIEQISSELEALNDAPITFVVNFSEVVVGFDAADIDLSESTAAGALTASVTGSDDIYTVTVSGMTSGDTVVVLIPANAAFSARGVGNAASTSTDNSVTLTQSYSPLI